MPDTIHGAGIVARGVGKRYAGRSVDTLSDIDLDVPAGAFVTLLGPSGCGKSTLLRLLARLNRPTRGRIDYTGRAEHVPDCALVPQEPTLLPWKSVFDNVYLPLKLRGQSKGAARDAVFESLRATGLQDRADAYPRELSGGMKMRVSIARALVTDPDVLLMDEPFAALDELTRHRLNDDLRALYERRRPAVVFVTHSVEEAVFLSTTIVALRDGRIDWQLPVDFGPDRTDLRERKDYAQVRAEVSARLRGAWTDRS